MHVWADRELYSSPVGRLIRRGDCPLTAVFSYSGCQQTQNKLESGDDIMSPKTKDMVDLKNVPVSLKTSWK